jgi:two-component system response regulator
MFKKNLDVFIGGRIKDHRQKIGLTLADLSKSLGISLQQLQKYEKGKTRISAGTLFELMKIFEIPFNYFYDGYENLVTSENFFKGNIKLERTLPLNVLIVESDSTDRFKIRNAILECDKTTNILILDQEAQVLSFLKRERQAYPFPRPDLILLALDSMHLDGFYMLKEIKRDSTIQDIPVIMLANSSSKEDLIKCYKHHASGYIQKCCCEKEILKPQISKAISYWSSVCLPHM